MEVFSNKELSEIFKIIFPEFRYTERLKGINNEVFKKFIKSEKYLLFALLLLDESDNHIYFSHKYKVSNYLKEHLIFCHKYFNELKKNKNFFTKDLKKNIFYYGKENIKFLAKLYFISRSKKNYLNLTNILKEIDSMNVPKFPITGKYLLDQGFKSGRKVGEALKKIEQQWVKNNFNLKDEELKNLIKKNN